MMTIAQRAKFIRLATPNCLEELFEMQNRICDLCGYPIQDLVLASLEHSTPVNYFARNFELDIIEAIQKANSLSNLRAVHSSCNSKKGNKTREEWFFEKKNRDINCPRFYTLSELEDLRNKLSDIGRIGGRIAAETGQIKTIKTYESSLKGARNQKIEDKARGGVTQGLKNIENGHMERMRAGRLFRIQEEKKSCPAVVPIKKIVDRKYLLDSLRSGRHSRFKHEGTVEDCVKCNRSSEEKKLAHNESCRTSYKKNHIYKSEEYLEQTFKENGHKQGLKNSENGTLIKALHVRWHVKRGIVSPDCPLCKS